jgi:transcriptional regulator with XRE-family HTH domain
VSRVGENIKAIRLEAGMSQKQLAKKLGVAESFVNELELGRKVANEILINRISKILGKQINDIGMPVDEENIKEVQPKGQPINRVEKKKTAEAIQDVWSDAFGSVLKNVPVLTYDMKKKLSERLLPVVSNKIEGHPQDKVFYLEIENDDMIGFRMAKGDLALAHITVEAKNNDICLIEVNGERVIRQVKKLDSNKAILISNRGSLKTEAVNIKDIKVIAKLDRVEIKL